MGCCFQPERCERIVFGLLRISRFVEDARVRRKDVLPDAMCDFNVKFNIDHRFNLNFNTARLVPPPLCPGSLGSGAAPHGERRSRGPTAITGFFTRSLGAGIPRP